MSKPINIPAIQQILNREEIRKINENNLSNSPTKDDIKTDINHIFLDVFRTLKLENDNLENDTSDLIKHQKDDMVTNSLDKETSDKDFFSNVTRTQSLSYPPNRYFYNYKRNFYPNFNNNFNRNFNKFNNNEGTKDENKNGKNEISESTNSSISKEFKNFKPKRKIRKCAYILAILSLDFFKEFGAVPLEEDPNIYIANRTYTNDSSNETCAVIGINKHYVRYLFDDNSILYQKLRASNQTKNIYGIESLRSYRLEPVKHLLKFLYFVPEKDIIVFNLEPKGKDDKVKIYPTANICVPGGGMETSDNNCYELCGRREFQEETKINIPKFIKYIVRQKFNFQDRQAMYFMIKMYKDKEIFRLPKD